MTVADLRRTLTPGVRVSVTNHYISKPDHPCYGTREAEIVRANSSTFALSLPPGSKHSESSVNWPKRAQLRVDDDGTIHIFGGGIAQGTEEPFLTIQVLA